MRCLCSLFATVLFLSIPIVVSCQFGQELTGRYESDHPDENRSMTLILKPDGKGSWTINGEEVPFQWDAGGDKIWLHSKSGGVIRGDISKEGAIDLTLPGVGKFLFRKL